jgi:hypothetical protein
LFLLTKISYIKIKNTEINKIIKSALVTDGFNYTADNLYPGGMPLNPNTSPKKKREGEG